MTDLHDAAAPPRIDLFSDTVTRPTDSMRAAMAAAEVGDEQLGEDPTTNRLTARVAELLGTEDAMFAPSGAMCNLVSYAIHCRPGDEVLLDRTAHPIHYEVGGVAAVAGAQLQPLAGRRGIFSAADVERHVRPPADHHQPRTRVVSIEQTANAAGGTVWPLETVAQVAEVARAHGLAMHLDGARLLNAVAATGVPASEWCRHFDSCWIDLSKGLGCPVGAVLGGSRAFIAEARRVKQRLGGSLRQSGILAAAGLHALDHHVERLAEDHANAKLLAGLVAAGAPGVSLDLQGVESNIVIMDVEATGVTAERFLERLRTAHGVRCSPMGGTLVRAVTHLDVDADAVRSAAAAIVSTAQELRARLVGSAT